jgi:hypothetical protein
MFPKPTIRYFFIALASSLITEGFSFLNRLNRNFSMRLFYVKIKKHPEIQDAFGLLNKL